MRRLSAATLSTGPRLGDVLVETGDIPRQALEATLTRSPNQTVAHAVVEHGLMSEEALADH